MENLAVKLGYLSKTQNNANQKHPQNNQLEALHLLLWKNKLPQMKNTCKLKPFYDAAFMPHYACLCSAWSCWFSMHAYREKKQVKMTSQDLNCSTKITMPVHDFKCNFDTTAYHKSEHQNRSVRLGGIKLIFMILLRSAKKSYDPSYSLICLNYICHFFIFLIWCKFSFSYCLWLYCLCLWPPRTNDESKGNTTTNSKSKNIYTISHKRVMGKCSSDMLPGCICPCTAACKMRTVNICICLTPHIISFLTVKELLDIVLALNSKVKNDLSELIWVEAYILPLTQNVWDQAVTLHFYLNIVNIVYYDDWLLYSFFFNKIYICLILDFCFTYYMGAEVNV